MVRVGRAESVELEGARAQGLRVQVARLGQQQQEEGGEEEEAWCRLVEEQARWASQARRREEARARRPRRVAGPRCSAWWQALKTTDERR